MLKINVVEIAGRRFIDIHSKGEYDYEFKPSVCIPVDRIKEFDFKVPNGGASGNSVKIVTDDPDDCIVFAFENCECVARFIAENSV